MIVTTDDVRHRHLDIVDHHGQVIRRITVGPEHDKIFDVGVVELDAPMHEIVEGGRAIGHSVTNRGRAAGSLAGGSFGRRGVYDSDYIAETAEIVKVTGRSEPIKLVWTREDDIKGGYYRPVYVHKVRVGLDKSGAIRLLSVLLGGAPETPRSRDFG